MPVQLLFWLSVKVKVGLFDFWTDEVEHRPQIVVRYWVFCPHRRPQLFKLLLSYFTLHLTHKFNDKSLDFPCNVFRIFWWRNQNKVHSQNSSCIGDTSCKVVSQLLFSSQFVEEWFFNMVFQQLQCVEKPLAVNTKINSKFTLLQNKQCIQKLKSILNSTRLNA